MYSRFQFEIQKSSRAHGRARMLRRGAGLASTLSLLAACGSSPDSTGAAVGNAEPPPSPVDFSSPSDLDGLDPSAVASPPADFGVSQARTVTSLRPSGARQSIAARTRSITGVLDAETRKVLTQLGRIEHTFSDGRVVEFVNSDAGNFGTADLILGRTENLPEFIEGVETHTRSLVTDDDDDTWPNGIIPYEIDSNITGSDWSAVLTAVSEWNRDSPIVRWVASNGSGDRVRFTKVSSSDFCGRSPVGRSFTLFGPQEIELVCFSSDTIVHEMGHAAGLHHEQQRCGRDAFVSVHDDPATGDGPRGTDYDELCGDSRNYGDYDYASVMHYPATQFLDILNAPTGVFMGLPSIAGSTSRLSQDDVNGVTWLHTKKNFSTTNGYGFAWAQQATGTFEASNGYVANSAVTSGSRAAITRVAAGRYRVDFPKLGKEVGGNVQVTAYGSDSSRCKAESWTSSGETLRVNVRCVTAQGVLADRLFDVSYQRRASPSPGVQGGYLYSNRVNEVGAYTPDPWYQWNSAGRQNRVTRTNTGAYLVEFPGINVNGGTVRLTAFGPNSDYCAIGSWGSSVVMVNCFDTAGNPKDSAFSLAFTDSAFTGTFGYAWANDPSNARYAPSSFYQKVQMFGSSTPVTTPIMANRQNVGDYKLEIPGVPPFASTVSVAAYGSNNSCKVAGWGAATSVGPFLVDRRENVFVRCFNPSGAPADSLFAITYMTDEYIIP